MSQNLIIRQELRENGLRYGFREIKLGENVDGVIGNSPETSFLASYRANGKNSPLVVHSGANGHGVWWDGRFKDG